MYVTWRHLVLLVGGLAAIAFLVAWSGIISVAASSGHSAITDWALHWGMRKSVRTHALGIEPPAVTGLPIVAAAGHFAAGCAPCHGAPGEPASPVAGAMTPPPPDLIAKIGEWTDQQLFWIVQNGVKFTGMPAWPAIRREDEVWGMVAFLRRLPDLDARSYRRLAYGYDDPAGSERGGALQTVLADCARCHGEDGAGREQPNIPVLAGQKPEYLAAALRAYAAGDRRSGIMQQAASGLTEAVIDSLARHYAGLTPVARRQPAADADLTARGAEIATLGLPRNNLPPCLSCHEATAARHRSYPVLDGQPREYIAGQLRAWQAGTRGGSVFAGIMASMAARLPEEDVESVSAYFASRHESGQGRNARRIEQQP